MPRCLCGTIGTCSIHPVVVDTERKSMEARARELEEQLVRGNTPLGGRQSRCDFILKALTQVGDERYREGMEEAAKVCRKGCMKPYCAKGDECPHCQDVAAIREKIKEAPK